MKPQPHSPRVLVVCPEVTYLPEGMGSFATAIKAKAGGLGDTLAALIDALYKKGVDVHAAIPDYRAIFKSGMPPSNRGGPDNQRETVIDEKIHLAEDRVFFHRNQVYSGNVHENIKASLAFQREVMYNFVPRIQPDLIHCNDWMTGLIPAMAAQLDIPCLFTVHSQYNAQATLDEIEDRGIDAAAFWQNLYYSSFPSSYEATRESIPVDFLNSGIFASSSANGENQTLVSTIAAYQPNYSRNQANQTPRLKIFDRFDCRSTIRQLIALYEQILNRPLVDSVDPGDKQENGHHGNRPSVLQNIIKMKHLEVNCPQDLSINDRMAAAM